MVARTSILALALAGATSAGPLLRRQESPSAPSAAQTTAGTTVSLTPVTGTATASSAISSAVSSVTSALSSVASSAAQNTSTAPAPTGTPVPGPNQTFPYACPVNYSLTYVFATNTYPQINISTAYDSLFNWNTALPAPITLVNQSGSGAGQAQRTWSLSNLTVSEQLVNQTANASTGYLNQNWVSTSAINVSPSLIISNATSDLTLFANGTAGNVTSVQFYVNFCASSQPGGLEFYSQIVSAYLTGLNGVFLNRTTPAPAGNTTAPVANATSSLPSSATSAASSVASGASSVASSVTGGGGGVVSSITSGGGGVVNTVVSGATGAVGTLTSGAVGAASTAVGAVTSLFRA